MRVASYGLKPPGLWSGLRSRRITGRSKYDYGLKLNQLRGQLLSEPNWDGHL